MIPGRVIAAIQARRSTRSFQPRTLQRRTITRILEAGRWAPSGLNNQPWRFVIVRDLIVKQAISACTVYSSVLLAAPCIILVFLDKKASYHRIKDAQAVGACIQNMLLCAHELGIASCWMGEILNRKWRVNACLGLQRRYELMAALALGHQNKKTKSKRLLLRKLILKDIS